MGSKMVHEVFIALGSNQGRRIHHLQRAVEALTCLSERPVRCSSVYETTPVGYLEQPDFLNMVMSIQTSLEPLQLLQTLHEIEQNEGRVRAIQNGPRTLDLDILLYDNLSVCYQMLQIPHPRMWERGFVIIPLAELVPQRRGLGGVTLAEMAENLSESGVEYVGHIW